MPRQSKNLSLDPEAIRRGERYSELHQTNIPQLVSNFLLSLPLDSDEVKSSLSPVVRCLLGVASGGTDVEDYHRHLVVKYGQ